MLDLHTHVWPHEPGCERPSYERLEKYCERAGQLGITQIAVTEHSHRFTRILDSVEPHWCRERTGALADATNHVLEVEGGADLDDYVEALLDAQSSGLPLLVGLEVDFLPGAMEAMADVLADYPFDVLLGSVHWLDAWLFDAYGDPVFAQPWRDRGIGDVYQDYIEAVAELAGCGLVDVLAHPDVIKVAGHRPADVDDYECQLAEVITSADFAVEFSSAGLRKNAAEHYPSAGLLRQIVNGGADLTTASDAHAVEQIGFRFDELRTALHHLQVTELLTFKGRRRVTVPISP